MHFFPHFPLVQKIDKADGGSCFAEGNISDLALFCNILIKAQCFWKLKQIKSKTCVRSTQSPPLKRKSALPQGKITHH